MSVRGAPDAAIRSRDPASIRVAAPLEHTIDVETPEQVLLTYTLAGVGSRAAAAIVDYLICFAIFLALVFALSVVATAARRALNVDDATRWAVAIFLVGQFLVLWGYYVLFEGLRDGQTPGKRRLGLRVVRDGGHSIGFGTSAIRNIMRAIDMQPGVTYGVGIVSSTLSKSGKRLGDMVAGTLVVQERVVAVPAALSTKSDRETRGHADALLTDDEYALLERFVARRTELDQARRGALAGALALRFRARAPELEGGDAAFVLRLAEQERRARARGAAGRSDTGAQREQHAIVAHGADRWAAFAAAIASARRRGIESLGEEGVSDFVARYRELTTDLARLRTATRGREFGPLFHLSRLVAAGHNLLYSQRPFATASLRRFLLADVPAEVRRSWRPILLAALLLLVPAAVTAVAVVKRPQLAAELLPREMINRAETARARERSGGGFLPDEMAREQGPLLTSLVTTNNVQVTFLAFALGVTLGAGTVLVLVFNGIGAIGAPVGLYVSKGVDHQIWNFVAAHGVLEITAIALSGGAGLLLGAALLLPGSRTRKDALVDHGVRAIRLVTASVLFLIVAGLLEGNVSPLPWPNESKYVVSALTAFLAILYPLLGRPARPRASAGQPTALSSLTVRRGA